ncbi:glycosyltransferase [Streptomyces sp. NPDC057654]|uniref:glycosyltransferase n=1 Tax=Streptomyces sp. NPDC057654 TaxID=3346196 RepID=UPI0036A40441
MRIMVVTAGSRGDVAPYTGLARRLSEAGHHVAFATHHTFTDMVRAGGFEVRTLPGDPQELIRARTEGRSEAEKKRVTAEFLSNLGEGVAEAAEQGTDVILSSLGQAPLSCLVAEGLGLPSMGVYLAPAVPNDAFALPGSDVPAGPGTPLSNRAAGERTLDRAHGLYAEVLPRLARRLRLPEAAVGTAWRRWQGKEGWPISHGVSPAVLPRPADWPPEVDMAGYWWPEPPSADVSSLTPAWQPPEELLSFLAAGPPPVFLGFGSMAPGLGERLGPLIVDAVRRAGTRAVVQAGWAGLDVAGDQVLTVGDVPHDWLFPRMAAVVHHAGAGTTGAGLRAGAPTVAVPVMADQPFWASRVYELGAGPAPVPFGELSAERLGEAIRAAVEEPGYRRRAAELARLIGMDDGAERVLRRVEAITTA